MNNKYIRIFLIAAAAVLSGACQLRPLEDPSAELELRVQVELKTVLNVNTSIYNTKIPVPTINTDMIRVMFYDPDTHQLITQAFISEKVEQEGKSPTISGTVNIDPGTYDMICYNFDTPDTFVRNENDITTIEAYTSEVSTSIKSQFAPSLPDGTDIYYIPDHVIVAREMGLEIKPHTGLLVIETEATTIVDTYYIQVCANNITNVASASAVITGMTPSNKFGIDERQTDKPCAVWFQLVASTDEKITGGNQNVLCATFNTFGKIYHDTDSGSKAVYPEDSEFVITYTTSGSSSKTYEYRYDMNEIFMSEDALERHWLIINDTVDVPEPDPGPSGGGGFTPTVDDWDDETGDIVI